MYMSMATNNYKCVSKVKSTVNALWYFKVDSALKFNANFHFNQLDLCKHLKGVFAKNERGYRPTAKKWSLLILLLSVASIRRKLFKTAHPYKLKKNRGCMRSNNVKNYINDRQPKVPWGEKLRILLDNGLFFFFVANWLVKSGMDLS